THQLPDLPVPMLLIRIVDGERPAVRRNANVRMRQQELADGWVECESVRTLSGRIDQHRARSIDHVARRDLTPAGLEKILLLAVLTARDLLYDRENRPHRDVDVDVGGTVERIEHQTVLAAAELLRDRDDSRLFFRRHPA